MKVDLNEGLKRVRYVVQAIIIVSAAFSVLSGWQSGNASIVVETFSPSDGWHYTKKECKYQLLEKFDSPNNYLNSSFDRNTGDIYDDRINISVPNNLKDIVYSIETCYRANNDGIVPIPGDNNPYFKYRDPIDVADILVRYVKNRDSKIELSEAETKKIREREQARITTDNLRAIGKALFWSLLIIGILEATSWIIGWVFRGFARRTEP